MMTANPYQVFGSSVPSMLGRQALIKEIEARLLKDTPDHVSIVGPMHYGKSVLLSHLAATHRAGSSHYLTTVYIDFRISPPASDTTFKQRLASALKTGLQPVRSELSGHIDPEYERVHELLDDVFADLAKEKEIARMLVVLDGFDHVLAGTGLTRNLWDQLRELARRPSLRLVTGSRRRLRELCRTREARSSNFWGIFHDPPSQVSILDASDWDAFLLPLLEAGCTLDAPARKELVNWTGGVPVLVCALLQELWETRHGRAQLSKPEIDEAAKRRQRYWAGHARASRPCGTTAMTNCVPISARLRVPAFHWPTCPTTGATRSRAADSAAYRRIAFKDPAGSCSATRKDRPRPSPTSNACSALLPASRCTYCPCWSCDWNRLHRGTSTASSMTMSGVSCVTWTHRKLRSTGSGASPDAH